MSVALFLSEVDGFRSVGRSALENVAASSELRTFAPEEYLMRSGEKGDHMHVIMEGRVRVPVLGEDGEERMVFRLGPRDLVGEMALLSGGPRTADVIADEPVKTIVLLKDTVDALLAESPELAGFLSEILGKRLEEVGGVEQVGKYRILGKLGEGSTGQVFSALHPGLGRVVAIKMLLHSLVYQVRFRERFLEEARTIATLSHPNIVQVFDTEAAYGTYFIVMEQLPDDNLFKLITRKRTLPPERICSILLQMCSALAYAHSKGFSHRDVKPENVAIDPSGTVKIMDFGLARPILHDADGKKATSVDGTPQYIAPETAMGRQGDGRVDIYALGVMAFEMLTGELPFDFDDVVETLKAHVRTPPPDIRKLAPDAPDGLLTFIEQTMRKRPDDRLSDWAEMRRLLAPADAAKEDWSRATEEVLRIRYQPRATARVGEAVEELFARLRDEDGVELARGRLERAGQEHS